MRDIWTGSRGRRVAPPAPEPPPPPTPRRSCVCGTWTIWGLEGAGSGGPSSGAEWGCAAVPPEPIWGLPPQRRLPPIPGPRHRLPHPYPFVRPPHHPSSEWIRTGLAERGLRSEVRLRDLSPSPATATAPAPHPQLHLHAAAPTPDPPSSFPRPRIAICPTSGCDLEGRKSDRP